MLLVALLVGLCMPMMAQTTSTTDNLLNIAGLEPEVFAPDAESKKMYYVKNVGSGLYMSYGGGWGTQCIESQSAHAVVLLENSDGTVAIANHGGYLESNGLWMDFAPQIEGELTSRWRLVPVEGYTNQYYLYAVYGGVERVLSSVGHGSGVLALKSLENKALQRWIFTDRDDLMSSKMPNASADQPVDVSTLISGGSFDYADSWEPDENNSAFILDEFQNVMPYDKTFWGDDYVDVKKWMADCGVRTASPLEYNWCGILRGGKDALSVDYKLTLPAGVYRFTCEGFYQCRADVTVQPQNYSSRYGWSDYGKASVSEQGVEMNAFIEIITGEGDESLKLSLPMNNDIGYSEDNTYTGPRAAAVFRDNDTYEQSVEFYLGGRREVTIRVVKEKLENNQRTESTGNNKRNVITTEYIDVYKDDANNLFDILGNEIYLDNFCLYYSGAFDDELPTLSVNAPSVITDDSEMYERFGSAAWFIIQYNEHMGVDYPIYLSNTWNGGVISPSELSEYLLTESQYNDQLNDYNEANSLYQEQLKAYDEKLNAVYASTDDNIIYKNYLNANINEYNKTLGTEGQKVFADMLASLEVKPNEVESRSEYYQDIANMELAYEYARATDAKEQGKDQIKPEEEDHIDFSGAIFNHTFDFFTLGNDGRNKPTGWTYVNSNDTQVAQNFHKTYITDGADGLYIYNTWGVNSNGEGYFGGTPISQTVTDLPTGTYLLSALMTSDAGNHLSVYAEDKERIFQVDHAGNVFDDYGVRFEVGTDGEAFLGVAGAMDNGTCTRDANGRWYKCDNFRLEYLPNGVLTLKEDAERITNIDDSFHGVKVERSKMSTKNWSTFVVPFLMAELPTGWEVMEITGAEARPVEGSEYEDLNLEFAAATSIEAGKPYLVRLKAEPTDGTIRTAVSTSTPNVAVKTRTFDNPQITVLGNGYDYTVEFIGSYTQCTIPNSLDADGNETGTDYYFLSGNKFYRSTGNGNVMKGFRGYFKVTQTKQPDAPAGAKGLRSLAMTRTETDIENVVDNEEVTVVAIYNVNGVKLESMQPGINILRMNNGTTKKVMVK